MKYHNKSMTIMMICICAIMSYSCSIFGLISPEQVRDINMRKLESKETLTDAEQEELRDMYQKLIASLERQIKNKESLLRRSRLTPQALANQKEQLNKLRQERDRIAKKLKAVPCSKCMVKAYA